MAIQTIHDARAAIESRFDAHQLGWDATSSQLFLQLRDDAAIRLLTEPNREREALDNADTLADLARRHATTQDLLQFHQGLRRLCPLFPFC